MQFLSSKLLYLFNFIPPLIKLMGFINFDTFLFTGWHHPIICIGQIGCANLKIVDFLGFSLNYQFFTEKDGAFMIEFLA